jgi:hypothetical protein
MIARLGSSYQHEPTRFNNIASLIHDFAEFRSHDRLDCRIVVVSRSG